MNFNSTKNTHDFMCILMQSSLISLLQPHPFFSYILSKEIKNRILQTFYNHIKSTHKSYSPILQYIFALL